MAVDTLKLYERFRKASLQDEAAKEIAEAFKETSDELTVQLATKDDLKAEIGNLEVRLIKWMIGIGIASFTAMLGLLKILKVI
jgi:hypothetical protein